MIFEPRYEKITSSYKVALGNAQTAVECKLPVDDGKVNKIISSCAKAYIQNNELIGNVVNYNGYVSFQVIYLNENGVVECLDYTAEFKDKIALENEFVGNVYLVGNVIDLESAILEDGVRANAVIDVIITGVGNISANMLSTINSNACYIKNELINYTTYKGVATNKFELTQEAQIKDSVEKVLSVCPFVYLESVTPNDKFLTVKGSVCVNISYLTAGEYSLPRNHQTTFDFVQEIAMEDIKSEDFVDSMIAIVINELKVTTAIEVDMCNVSMVIPIKYDGYVFENNRLDGVTDIYSATNYLSTEYSTISNLSNYETKDYMDKLTGNILIDDNAPFVDEVLGVVCSNVVIAKKFIENDNLIVEGVGYCTVLYYTKELNSISSHEVQMPFSNAFKIDGENYKNTEIDLNATLCDITTKSKRGKEIDISGNLYFYVEFYENQTQTFISNVVAGDDKPADEFVLNVYIVKAGEDVWDVAKEMNVSPELIMEQNPEIELPLKAGDKIIIYKQKMVEF